MPTLEIAEGNLRRAFSHVESRQICGVWPDGSTIRGEHLAALFQDVKAELEAENATLRAERDRLQQQIESFSVMLGWENTPPQGTLESEIRAMKARIVEYAALRAACTALPRRLMQAFNGEWIVVVEAADLDRELQK